MIMENSLGCSGWQLWTVSVPVVELVPSVQGKTPSFQKEKQHKGGRDRPMSSRTAWSTELDPNSLQSNREMLSHKKKKQINKKVILFAYQWKHKLKDFELLKIFSKFAWRQLYSHQGLLWQRLRAYFQIILIKQMRNNTPTHSVLHIIKWDFCKKLIFPPPHTASVVVSKLSPGDMSC